MSKATPSKLDQYAERIAEWFTDKKTLAWVRAQLAADGLTVSLSQLSRWWARWQQRQERQQALEMINDLSEDLESKFLAYNPEADKGRVRGAVMAYLMEKGAATGDNSLALNAARLQQAEAMARTRAEQKSQELAIAQTRLLMESDAFLAKVLAKAEELTQSGLSNAEKIASLRQIYFADVEALQRSGTIKLPS